jgi:hypothetical protein
MVENIIDNLFASRVEETSLHWLICNLGSESVLRRARSGVVFMLGTSTLK